MRCAVEAGGGGTGLWRLMVVRAGDGTCPKADGAKARVVCTELRVRLSDAADAGAGMGVPWACVYGVGWWVGGGVGLGVSCDPFGQEWEAALLLSVRETHALMGLLWCWGTLCHACRRGAVRGLCGAGAEGVCGGVLPATSGPRWRPRAPASRVGGTVPPADRYAIMMIAE